MNSLRLRRHVEIGPILREYADSMLRWLTDPTISVNLGLRSVASLERTREWIDYAQHNEDILALAITYKGLHVGNVVIDRIDRHLGIGRLHVYVGESSALSKGVGATGMYLAIQKCFQEFGLNKVWLTVHVRNVAAIRSYYRLGFLLEGILRDEFWLEGERVPVLYMGLLRRDFDLLDTEWM